MKTPSELIKEYDDFVLDNDTQDAVNRIVKRAHDFGHNTALALIKEWAEKEWKQLKEDSKHEIDEKAYNVRFGIIVALEDLLEFLKK